MRTLLGVLALCMAMGAVAFQVPLQMSGPLGRLRRRDFLASPAIQPHVVSRRMGRGRSSPLRAAAEYGLDQSVKEDGAGSGSSTFVWEENWYPVAAEKDLKKVRPTKATLLGQDFVVWFSPTSQTWRAFTDRCPHRAVPLSEGRIEPSTGFLQCAYHGWEFGDGGACERIPQLGESKSDAKLVKGNKRTCVRAYPCRVAQGLVWLFPAGEEALAAGKGSEMPLIPELDMPGFLDATDFFTRDLPYSYDMLVENLADPSHIPFSHHGIIGGADRNTASKLDLRVVERSSTGVKSKKNPMAESEEYEVIFKAPCLMYYRISLKNGSIFLGLGQYCIPTAKGRCRLITRFPFKLPKIAMFFLAARPRWINHMSQNIVLDSDMIFLTAYSDIKAAEGQGPAQWRKEYYMPSATDAMVAAFRHWLEVHGGGGPAWMGTPAERSIGEPSGWTRPRSVPALQGRDALLDRYRQHTDICPDCSAAHRNLGRAREAMRLLGAMCVAAAAALRAGSVRARWLLAVGGVLVGLVLPRVAVEPLIARMEVVPWPSKTWLKGKPRPMIGGADKS